MYLVYVIVIRIFFMYFYNYKIYNFYFILKIILFKYNIMVAII